MRHIIPGRGIPPRGVARRSDMPNILAPAPCDPGAALRDLCNTSRFQGTSEAALHECFRRSLARKLDRQKSRVIASSFLAPPEAGQNDTALARRRCMTVSGGASLGLHSRARLSGPVFQAPPGAESPVAGRVPWSAPRDNCESQGRARRARGAARRAGSRWPPIWD